MFAGRQPAEPRQRGNEPDGAVAAHVQVAHVVEEDHTGGAGGVCGWREQGAYHHIVAARFIHYCRAEVVVLFTELHYAFGQ